MRGELGANQKIEAWLLAYPRRPGGERVDRLDAIRKRMKSIETAQKELNPIIKIVVETNFGNGHIYGNLQLRPIELIECFFDDTVIFRVGIDHDRIVRD